MLFSGPFSPSDKAFVTRFHVLALSPPGAMGLKQRCWSKDHSQELLRWTPHDKSSQDWGVHLRRPIMVAYPWQRLSSQRRLSYPRKQSAVLPGTASMRKSRQQPGAAAQRTCNVSIRRPFWSSQSGMSAEHSNRIASRVMPKPTCGELAANGAQVFIA